VPTTEKAPPKLDLPPLTARAQSPPHCHQNLAKICDFKFLEPRPTNFPSARILSTIHSHRQDGYVAQPPRRLCVRVDEILKYVSLCDHGIPAPGREFVFVALAQSPRSRKREGAGSLRDDASLVDARQFEHTRTQRLTGVCLENRYRSPEAPRAVHAPQGPQERQCLPEAPGEALPLPGP